MDVITHHSSLASPAHGDITFPGTFFFITTWLSHHPTPGMKVSGALYPRIPGQSLRQGAGLGVCVLPFSLSLLHHPSIQGHLPLSRTFLNPLKQGAVSESGSGVRTSFFPDTKI